MAGGGISHSENENLLGYSLWRRGYSLKIFAFYISGVAISCIFNAFLSNGIQWQPPLDIPQLSSHTN